MSQDKKKSKAQAGGNTIIARNKRARFDYFIEETMEAGIVLVGTEVKALRSGKASINECYAGEHEGEIFLYNAYIPEYSQAGGYFQHMTRRPRKLLLHKKEVGRLLGSIQKKGVTLVPISLYFTPRGRVKVDLGIAKGKKQHDKRQTEKNRDWSRDKSRILREKN